MINVVKEIVAIKVSQLKEGAPNLDPIFLFIFFQPSSPLMPLREVSVSGVAGPSFGFGLLSSGLNRYVASTATSPITVSVKQSLALARQARNPLARVFRPGAQEPATPLVSAKIYYSFSPSKLAICVRIFPDYVSSM